MLEHPWPLAWIEAPRSCDTPTNKVKIIIISRAYSRFAYVLKLFDPLVVGSLFLNQLKVDIIETVSLTLLIRSLTLKLINSYNSLLRAKVTH